jgi:predicted nucleic acid-binding protein
MSKNKAKLKQIVLDASVFNKLFLNEQDSSSAIDYIEKINNEGYKILVPSIFLYEVLGVAEYYKCNTKEIYDLICEYESNNLQIINPDSTLIKQALEMTTKGHDKSGYPSFYDSVYHALAIQNNCDFITADKKHFEKVKHLGHIKYFEDL